MTIKDLPLTEVANNTDVNIIYHYAVTVTTYHQNWSLGLLSRSLREAKKSEWKPGTQKYGSTSTGFETTTFILTHSKFVSQKSNCTRLEVLLGIVKK